MNWQQHIHVNPAICKGRACITGTRITVSSVLDNLADGMTAEAIVASYWRAFPRGQSCYTIFDFHKRFRCRANMRKAFARHPTLVHPDCKTQEVETFLSSIKGTSGTDHGFFVAPA